MRSLFGLGLVILACGCAESHATFSELRTRAAFDFNCNRQDLQVVPLSDDVAGVKGCGHQATYVEQCQDRGPAVVNSGVVSQNRSCSWVMDASRESNAASR